MSVRIRPMELADSAAVSELSGQLGYPASTDEVSRRFLSIAERGDAIVLVAEADARVVGWIHVAITPVLESDLYGEIGGLIIDDTYRSRGIGAELLRAGEQWARNAGCAAMRVRSRTTRERAHAFYERSGYARIKTQHAFAKPLE